MLCATSPLSIKEIHSHKPHTCSTYGVYALPDSDRHMEVRKIEKEML